MNGSRAIDAGRVAAPPTRSSGSRLLVPLGRALDPREAGGKASNLSKLIGLGYPVPPGFVLTCEAFERFLAVDRLGAGIEALQRRLDPADPAGRREVSRAIRARVIGGPLPADVLEALDRAARELPARAGLAVRSSAVGEDGAAASFAGQFDSVLHVDTVEALRRAVRVCWASYWSERSLCYRAARNARLGGMAVVLQRQVSARVSGVLFTRAPAGTLGAADDDLVIECCPGLADRLVSGQVDPERLVVPRAGATAIGSVYSTGSLLSAADVRALTDVALRLERELGAPQDVEWSIDDDAGATVPELYQEGRGSAPRSRRTLALVSQAGLDFRPLDAALLERYFNEYVAAGFLPPPRRCHWSASGASKATVLPDQVPVSAQHAPQPAVADVCHRLGDFDQRTVRRLDLRHDFSPRNVAIRDAGGSPRLCAYDWELATLGAPQRDLAHFLCFVLDPGASGDEIALHVERHRAALAEAAGTPLDPGAWEAGFRAALADLLINRLMFYVMIHRVRPLRFLPRIARTWQRLHDLFGAVEGA